MMTIEQNNNILKAIGMAIVRINGVEELLRHFLASMLMRLNHSTMSDELKKMETSMLGDKLTIFREKILNIPQENRESLQKLCDELCCLREERTLLAHVAIAETVTIDTNKIPQPTGQFVFLDYVRRPGNIHVPSQPADQSRIDQISALAAKITTMIYQEMTWDYKCLSKSSLEHAPVVTTFFTNSLT